MKTKPLAKMYRVPLMMGLLLSLFTHPSQADELPRLDDLISQRLAEMKSVAAYKWIHNLPIEDLPREQNVIAAAQRTGLQFGLTVTSSESFFRQQISAAKEIQHHWFRVWQNTEGPASAPDLNGDIRPKLIELGNQITAALAAHTRNPKEALFIQMEGLSKQTAEKLTYAVSGLKFYDNHLDQVVQSKILRVGTTYDYAPFSFRENDQPQGIDISLAENLADTLGAELVLVTTSWPNLMADLGAGNFDIAMSGVSINLERQKVALFSAPHHTGGKTPITRCEDVARFDSLSKIDQPGTRMVVNPGGTNQRFVDTNIQRANVRVHDDNRTIFKEILTNKADVMITDAIEVQLQSHLHNTELCPAMSGETLTHQRKGFLLPRDLIWKQYVDTWLDQRTQEGEVQRLFNQFLAPEA